MGLMCTLNCLSQGESRKCCIDDKFFLTVSGALGFASLFLHFLMSLFRILIYECRRELTNVTGSENDIDRQFFSIAYVFKNIKSEKCGT